MPKTIADIVHEAPDWRKLIKEKIYVDFQETTDSRPRVGQIIMLDLDCGMGYYYRVQPCNHKEMATWISDRDILGIHKFPKKQNG